MISGDTGLYCKLKVAACEVQQYETNVVQEDHLPYKSEQSSMTLKSIKINTNVVRITPRVSTTAL